MLPLLYTLALIALATGTAAIYMALIDRFPVEWLYTHYFVRKPIVWTIFLGSAAWVIWETVQTGRFPLAAILPLLIMGLSVVLAYKMHQERAFPAVDFPKMAEDPARLPITDEMQLAVIDYQGVTKAYPLDYVIHHHVINDRFGDRIVALTYCAMCRSIIPFDVTEIGPLFVGSFKGANMIVADRKTKTFFQQATFESIIGPLHPHTLTMIPFQILTWHDVNALDPLPEIAQVSDGDFRAFELPIPGIWKKIVASEATPGLPSSKRDTSFPARTHVIGVIDNIAASQPVYLKDEVLARGLVRHDPLDITLIGVNDTVNGFKGSLRNHPLSLSLNPNRTLTDLTSGTCWDLRGKYLQGALAADLEPVALSDEYWFSWKKYHPASELIRL